jgi:hypothetical protein
MCVCVKASEESMEGSDKAYLCNPIPGKAPVLSLFQEVPLRVL